MKYLSNVLVFLNIFSNTDHSTDCTVISEKLIINDAKEMNHVLMYDAVPTFAQDYNTAAKT
jgi:hypothetical protein